MARAATALASAVFMMSGDRRWTGTSYSCTTGYCDQLYQRLKQSLDHEIYRARMAPQIKAQQVAAIWMELKWVKIGRAMFCTKHAHFP